MKTSNITNVLRTHVFDCFKDFRFKNNFFSDYFQGSCLVCVVDISIALNY